MILFFEQSEKKSRDNDVTIVLAIELQPFSAFSLDMLAATYTLGACLLSSVV